MCERVEGENAADNNGKCLFPVSLPGKGFNDKFFFFFFWRALLKKNRIFVTGWQPKIRRSETPETTARFAGGSTPEETEWT